MPRPPRDTSWNKVTPWYSKLVGQEGHYYHQHLVLPGVLKLLELKPSDSLVDLGCGDGVLARSLPPIKEYLGLDAARGLIAAAQTKHSPANFRFQLQDVTKPILAHQGQFSHATIILALQNMRQPELAVKNAAALLQPRGKLVIVLNHPAFRIPRQSGWEIDEKTKQQYRWLNRYRSPLEIPITMHPGQNSVQVTWSFHHSLQEYFGMLAAAGFSVTGLEEWYSDKVSVGKASKMENRARQEIPLFLALVATKAP